MTKDEVLEKVQIKMMEDGIPDDDQPDKEFDYVIETLANEYSVRDLMDLLLGEARDFAKDRVSGLNDPTDIDEWLLDTVVEYVLH